MQSSIPSLLAMTLGALLATTQGPAMAEGLQINPAQGPGQAAIQQAAPGGQPLAAAPIQQGAIQQGAVQQGAVATTGVATETQVETTVQTAAQMNLLPVRTVLTQLIRNFDDPRAFEMPGFGRGRSRCGHVINMLMQKHMHEQFFGDNAPRVQRAAPLVALDPFGRPVMVNRRMGDLRLLNVEMVADATPEMGPLYSIVLHNDSDRIAQDFRVSLVAVHGGILPNSPTVTMNVDEIEAGATEVLQVQMPPQCLAIEIAGQAAMPFDTLVVAIDSFDELMEADELNNVAVLQRTNIVVIGATTETTVTTEAGPGQEVAPAGAAPAVAAPVESEPGVNPPGENDAPEGNAGPAPVDKLDLDNLDLDEEEEAETSFFIE